MFVKCENPAKVASRMFFLAYEASSVFGMGAFQARAGATEDLIWELVTGKKLADYAMPRGNESRPYADYVLGRMMKLGCEIKEDGIEIREGEPRPSQAWRGSFVSVGIPTEKFLENF